MHDEETELRLGFEIKESYSLLLGPKTQSFSENIFVAMIYFC